MIKKISTHLKDTKKFYLTAIAITIPIALQNFLMSSLNMIDVLMIGQLGETDLAGTALANQIFFIFIMILFGINSGTAIFTAQFWGLKKIPEIRKTFGLCLVNVTIFAFLFFIFSYFYTEKILSIYSKDPEIIKKGSIYLKILSPSFLFTALTFSYEIILRTVKDVKLSLYVSGFSLILNTLLNYLLIFGKGPFPALGIKGAAIATCITRILEFFVLIIPIYIKKSPLAANIKELFGAKLKFILKYYKIMFPVLINELGWALGMTFFSFVFARMGTEALTASTITDTIRKFLMFIFIGTSNAAAVMIGNSIGKLKYNLAQTYAIRFSIINFLLGIFLGIILLILSPIIPGFFNVSRLIQETTMILLIISAIIMPLKAFNETLIIGILRGGGDTKYSLILDVGCIWLIGASLSFIGGLILNYSIIIVFIFICLEELVKACFGLSRLRSKKWIHNLSN